MHNQMVHQLALARSKVLQANGRLLLLQQRYQGRQQQIQDSQTRIDQLLQLVKLEVVVDNPVPASTDWGRDVELVVEKKSASQVEQLQQQIDQRSELLRQSAHDLKSYFGIVRGIVDLLFRARTPKERQRMMSILQRNVQQAQLLLTQLLDVTRFEAGREQLQLTSFDVVDLLNELTEVMRPVAQEKNLWLRTQGVSSMVIEGDRVKLYRIAQNLLQNAIKYTRVGGVQLDWQTGVSEHEWHLTVTDTGPGLSAGHQLASGEEIGLLIVRQLCDLLGGRLSVIEPIEGGTQFILSFSRQYPS
ncbi:hypothetical protein GCM10028817_16860 [Spirosoma pomorum]